MIHKEEIVALLRALYEASGFRLSLYDASTRIVAYYPEGISRVCSAVHGSCGMLNACLASDRAAFAQARSGEGIYVYHCHMGLFEAICPIVQDGVLLGFLMMGQALEDTPGERERVAARLVCHGLTPEEADAALSNVAVCSRGMLESFGRIMAACAGYIALSSLLHANGGIPAEAARAYIEKHYAERVTIDELCRRFHCCRATMTAGYKRRYGETITDSLLRIRLENARELLLAGAGVTGAATACGFGDPSYFSKCYRRMYGISPSREKKEE